MGSQRRFWVITNGRWEGMNQRGHVLRELLVEGEGNRIESKADLWVGRMFLFPNMRLWSLLKYEAHMGS